VYGLDLLVLVVAARYMNPIAGLPSHLLPQRPRTSRGPLTGLAGTPRFAAVVDQLPQCSGALATHQQATGSGERS